LTAPRRFAKFIAAGAVNTVASYVLFLSACLIVPYWAAYTIAYAAGIALSYFLNARYVFAARMGIRSAAAFPLVYVAQYLLGLGLLALLVGRFAITPPLAALAAVIVTAPLSFVLARVLLTRLQPEPGSRF
jgi:putative flippase GtrA